VFVFVPPGDAREQPAQSAGRTDLTGMLRRHLKVSAWMESNTAWNR
jgi:hypothetical protein